jgi:hypothetical protein
LEIFRHGFSNSSPLPLAWAFAHVKKCVQVVHALAPNILVIPSNETMATFHLLHPLINVDLLPFVDDFHLDIEIILY